MVSRLAVACVEGLLFALAMWGVWSVLHAPVWTHHHLTDVLVWTGFVVASARFLKASAS